MIKKRRAFITGLSGHKLTKKEKFFLKEELDKYFKKNIIAKQKKYLIFYRGFKMQFRKYYDIFFNKNFKDILNFRNWLENN